MEEKVQNTILIGDENANSEFDNKNLYLPISSQVEESFNKSEVNENKINKYNFKIYFLLNN